MSKDLDSHYRTLASSYTEAIRNSDSKAFLGTLFTAIMMATALGFSDNYPRYLSTPVLVIPFLSIFLSLMICVYPRFPKVGRDRFPLRPNLDPQIFVDALNRPVESGELPMRCVLLSRILYWKTVTLRFSYFLAVTMIAIAQILLIVDHIWPVPH